MCLATPGDGFKPNKTHFEISPTLSIVQHFMSIGEGLKGLKFTEGDFNLIDSRKSDHPPDGLADDSEKRSQVSGVWCRVMLCPELDPRKS